MDSERGEEKKKRMLVSSLHNLITFHHHPLSLTDSLVLALIKHFSSADWLNSLTKHIYNNRNKHVCKKSALLQQEERGENERR